MGRRLRRWLALDGRQRLQLAACVPGVWLLHAGLALCGYAAEDLYLRPQTPAVAAFVGLSSSLPGDAEGDVVTVWGARLPIQGEPAHGAVDVLVRPENVRLAPLADADAGGALAQVDESTFLGSFRRSVLRTDDGVIVRVQHGADERLEYGERVRVTLATAPVTVRPRP